jgi:hypothetical protein
MMAAAESFYFCGCAFAYSLFTGCISNSGQNYLNCKNSEELGAVIHQVLDHENLSI